MYINKRNLNNEFLLRRNEYMESELALNVINNARELVPAVFMASNRIISIIREHFAQIQILVQKEKINIEAELYGGKFFGRLSIPSEEGVLDSLGQANRIIQSMVLALEGENICQHLQIHCIFFYRIYRHLNPQLIQKVKSLIQADEILNEKNRGRMLRSDQLIKPSQEYGLSRNSFFRKKLSNSWCLSESHERGMDRFARDKSSPFTQTLQDNNLPFASGASHHTCTLLTGFLSYNNMFYDQEAIKQYILGISAFLIAGGNHSFHEIIIIAKNILPLSVQPSEYYSYLPQSILRSKIYQEMQKKGLPDLEQPIKHLVEKKSWLPTAYKVQQTKSIFNRNWKIVTLLGVITLSAGALMGGYRYRFS